MADEIRLDVVSVAYNKGLTDAAAEMRKFRSEAEKTTGSLGDLEDGTFSLDKAIEETHEEVARLRQEFAKTGDTTLFGDMRRQQAALTNLQKIKEAIEDVTEATSEMGGAAAQAGGGGAQFGSAFGGRAGPAIVTGVIMGVAPFLPALGAMLAGAVAGTIGTGGIAGGIAMAVKDPRVKAAAEDFKESIAKEFFSGGDEFAGPIAAGLRQLEAAFKDMDLPETFAKMAPHVTTIARGFSDLGMNVMPGLNAAFDRMGPFAEAAADGLGNLGTAIGTFSDDVTSSEGTVEGLEAMFSMLSGAIIVTGKALNIASDAFHVWNKATIEGAELMAGLTAATPLTAFFLNARKGMLEVADSTSSFAQRAIEAAEAQIALTKGNATAAEMWKEIGERIRSATKAQDEYFARAMAVPEANDALQASFDAFTESLKENGRTFDENTEAGRNNREAMRDMISAAQEVRTAMIEQNGDVTAANRTYEANIKLIEAMGLKAGVTADELRGMAGDYYVNIYRKELTHKITYFSNHDLADTRRGFAEGSPVLGPTPAFEPFKVGERGTEWLFFDQQHFVATAAQVQAQASRSSGTQPVAARPVEVFGGGLGNLVFEWLRTEIQARGGQLAVIGLKAP